jgi:PIN domain nuclease of toxin-antitoxin system
MKTSVVHLLATVVSVAMVADSLASEDDGLKDTVERPKSRTSRAVAADPKAIAKLIEEINAAARTNKERMLSIMVINTDVASATLEQEKTRYGLTLGDVYVAHSLALATGKKVNSIFALHKSGKTWAQIAKSLNVSLKGSSELIKEMQRQ